MSAPRVANKMTISWTSLASHYSVSPTTFNHPQTQLIVSHNRTLPTIGRCLVQVITDHLPAQPTVGSHIQGFFVITATVSTRSSAFTSLFRRCHPPPFTVIFDSHPCGRLQIRIIFFFFFFCLEKKMVF
jgi:hypothetical protein